MCIHIQARLVRRHRAEAVLLRPALSRDEEEVVRRAAHESTAISTNCPECTSVVHPCLETQRDTVLCLFIRCGHSSTFANPLWIEVDPRCLYPRCLNDPAEIRGTSQISPCHFVDHGHLRLAGDPHRASDRLGRRRPRHPFSSNLPRASLVHSPRSRYACSASHAPFCMRTRPTTVCASR